MYEMMAVRTATENFTILDSSNVPITSARWTAGNKLATLMAFVNFRKVKEICVNHGLPFRNRESYNSDDTVDILGEIERAACNSIHLIL
jgi:hypothetical protein